MRNIYAFASVRGFNNEGTVIRCNDLEQYRQLQEVNEHTTKLYSKDVKLKLKEVRQADLVNASTYIISKTAGTYEDQNEAMHELEKESSGYYL